MWFVFIILCKNLYNQYRLSKMLYHSSTITKLNQLLFNFFYDHGFIIFFYIDFWGVSMLGPSTNSKLHCILKYIVSLKTKSIICIRNVKEGIYPQNRNLLNQWKFMPPNVNETFEYTPWHPCCHWNLRCGNSELFEFYLFWWHFLNIVECWLFGSLLLPLCPFYCSHVLWYLYDMHCRMSSPLWRLQLLTSVWW